MRLLLLRHAEAEDRAGSSADVDDASRPLTAPGRRTMLKVGNRLRILERRVDQIATSGLVRSEQSADALTRVYRRAKRVQLSALAPEGALEGVVEWLVQQPKDSVVALVGHEPGLGRLTGLLVAGRPSRAIALKTGGVCMLAFDAPPGPAVGMIRWMLTPSQMQRLKF